MTSERGFVRFPTTIESLISLFFINFVYKYYIYDILQYKYKSVKLFFVEMTDFFGRIELFHNNIQRVSHFSTQFPFIRSRRLSYHGKKKKKKILVKMLYQEIQKKDSTVEYLYDKKLL